MSEKITMESLWKSYENIQTMNTITGNLSASAGIEQGFDNKLDSQLSFVFEELTEAIDALESGDAHNFGKEVADVWVTVCGLLQIAQAAGYNLKEIIGRVDANNLAKFPDTLPHVVPDDCHRVLWNEQFKRFAILRKDGKFLKPTQWTKIDPKTLPAPVGVFANREGSQA
jgi:NTP pyrophosphatase (non-canonical NTP hydrolase)